MHAYPNLILNVAGIRLWSAHLPGYTSCEELYCQFQDNVLRFAGRMYTQPLSQDMNVPRLIWAFKFEPPTDPVTGEPEKVDVWNYARVSDEFTH
jgi:hypothetical protein